MIGTFRPMRYSRASDRSHLKDFPSQIGSTTSQANAFAARQRWPSLSATTKRRTTSDTTREPGITLPILECISSRSNRELGEGGERSTGKIG